MPKTSLLSSLLSVMYMINIYIIKPSFNLITFLEQNIKILPEKFKFFVKPYFSDAHFLSQYGLILKFCYLSILLWINIITIFTFREGKYSVIFSFSCWQILSGHSRPYIEKYILIQIRSLSPSLGLFTILKISTGEQGLPQSLLQFYKISIFHRN